MNSGKRLVDICVSDNLPCSSSIKGVGIGACVKNWHGTVRICCRFSDKSVSVLECSMRNECCDCCACDK